MDWIILWMQIVYSININPLRKRQAQHSREWGMTMIPSPSGKVDSEPTGECWREGGAFEML